MENTKIPKGSLLRPNVIANAVRANYASNLNVNGVGSGPSFANRRAILSRRSKSFAEFNRKPLYATKATTTFNPLLNRPISNVNSINNKPLINQVPTTRRPLAPTQLNNITTKRKADPPVTNSLRSAKVPLKTTAPKPATPPTKKITKKPAPYDYKARFQLLQERHLTLKSDHKDLSEKYEKLNENMAKYMQDSEDLKLKTADCEKKDILIENLKKELSDEKKLFAQCKLELADLKINFDTQKSNLQNIQKKYDELNNSFESLKSNTDKLVAEKDQLTDELSERNETIDNLVGQVCGADNERRRLHNIIQDLKGNIRVFCRVRPQLSDEVGKHLLEITYQDDCTLEVSNGSQLITSAGTRRPPPKQEFSFNHVFSENSTQEQVFLELGQLVQSVLDGYNVCVFAYGQTGSGKTFTMEGGYDSETLGMIPRTIDLLFKTIEERKILNWEYEVRASFLEIYNEQIYDLLNNDQLPHDIRMTDARGVDVYVTNLQVEVIENGNDLKQLLYVAQQNRAVATTIMNERSSRSHAVTKIEVIGTNTTNDETFHASLNLVDLAGSERARDSEMIRLNETKNINKSLANLSNVILALLQKKDHIPYRDSKLTHLLMPSLGGNSKTLMFVNISPLTECFNETLNSLRFAAKVNSCKVTNVRKNRLM